MNAHHDPLVRRELLAAVAGKSAEHIKHAMLAGKIPPFDASRDGKTRSWKLSTIAKWNPRLGRHIEALLKTPYIPAA